ncbi:uncharacterized protein LOC131948286 [Physella acuta]|uniref:uncharacterized protein LOC131948286 n=1 Tax=Physella acuta TaxID=109671 RepID=UPI0027DD0585|nr:uncharacterized protein LOC131948286 [Physella acuta]
MATTEYTKLILRCILNYFRIILFCSFILPVFSAGHCNYGNDISNQLMFQNQSCVTGEKHLSNLLHVYKNSSPDSGETDVSNLTANASHHCYIFRFVATTLLSHEVKKEAIHVEYGCDFQEFCKDKQLDQVLPNVTVGSDTGLLFCCAASNCNMLDAIPHLPAENRVCFDGVKNGSDHISGELESCLHPDVVCAKKTIFHPEGKVESYFCDNDKLCLETMSSGAFKACFNTSVGNKTVEELCCCDQSQCFLPPGTNLPASLKDNSTDEKPPSVGNTLQKPGSEKTDKLLVTGLIATFLFITGVGVGIVLVVACRKPKEPRRDPNVIMQYERLSSDLDMEDAVVL